MGPKDKSNNLFCMSLEWKIAPFPIMFILHKFYVICKSETFLNNTYNDKESSVNRYSVLRADHLNSVTKGGVCIYYKGIVALEDTNPIFKQKSSLWSYDLLAKILMNLSLSYQTLSFYVRIFPIITRTRHYYLVIIMQQEIRNSSVILSQQLEKLNLKSQLRVQTINRWTYSYPQKSLFIQWPDLRESGKSYCQYNTLCNYCHPSLPENCRHQITFARTSLKVLRLPPLNFMSELCKSGHRCDKAISQFNWQRPFTNLAVNFIPNTIIACNDLDPA